MKLPSQIPVLLTTDFCDPKIISLQMETAAGLREWQN